MPRIFIAVGPLPPRFEPYLAKAGAVELLDAGRNPIRRKVLRRLRTLAAPGFQFSLSAPDALMGDPLDMEAPLPEGMFRRDAGFFRDTETNRFIFREFVKEIEALKADFVHFRTPSAFGPSETNRAALTRFATEWLKDVPTQPVWEPRGLWQLDEARELVEPLGWIVSVDPFGDFEFPMPSAVGPTYMVLHAPRGRRMFSVEDFEEVADYVRAHEHDIFVTFRGPERHRNATAFARSFPEGTFEFEGPWMTTAMAQRALTDGESDEVEYEYVYEEE
jgi:hypothetical protein